MMKAFCNSLVYDGFDDWRLPTNDELDAMSRVVDYGISSIIGSTTTGQFASEASANFWVTDLDVGNRICNRANPNTPFGSTTANVRIPPVNQAQNSHLASYNGSLQCPAVYKDDFQRCTSSNPNHCPTYIRVLNAGPYATAQCIRKDNGKVPDEKLPGQGMLHVVYSYRNLPNLATNPEAIVLNGQSFLTRSGIRFPKQNRNQSKTVYLSLVNRGNSQIKINSTYVSPSYTTTLPQNVVIEPGQSFDFQLQSQAQSSDAITTGVFGFNTSISWLPIFAIPLSAETYPEVGPSNFQTITPDAPYKYNGRTLANVDTIDLGRIAVGSASVDIRSITGGGSRNFTDYYNASPYFISQRTGRALDFAFTPAKIGIFYADVFVDSYSGLLSDKRYYKLKATVFDPRNPDAALPVYGNPNFLALPWSALTASDNVTRHNLLGA